MSTVDTLGNNYARLHPAAPNSWCGRPPATTGSAQDPQRVVARKQTSEPTSTITIPTCRTTTSDLHRHLHPSKTGQAFPTGLRPNVESSNLWAMVTDDTGHRQPNLVLQQLLVIIVDYTATTRFLPIISRNCDSLYIVELILSISRGDPGSL